MVLMLYLGALVLLALLTAYTRNFQRTVLELDQALEAGGRLAPPAQGVRTMLVVALWPAALLIGLGFVAWWKAIALVTGSFVLLTPLLGSFTPRPGSAHYLDRLRADLDRRTSDAADERAELERLAKALEERVSRPPSGGPS